MVTSPTPGSGSVALVTGGTGGFGRALARKLRERGVTVVLSDLDSERNRQRLAGQGPARIEHIALEVASLAAALPALERSGSH